MEDTCSSLNDSSLNDTPLEATSLEDTPVSSPADPTSPNPSAPLASPTVSISPAPALPITPSPSCPPVSPSPVSPISPSPLLSSFPAAAPAPPAPTEAPSWRPWEFLAMLAVLAAFHLAFIFLILPVILTVAAQQGAPLPLLVRGYVACSRFMVFDFFPLGSAVLIASLGWLLGFHLVLRHRPRAQRVYVRAVYLALTLILVAVMALSLVGRFALLGDPLQY